MANIARLYVTACFHVEDLLFTCQFGCMYLFGHLGVGFTLVKPFWRKIPLKPFFIGTVISDLIDKPLYYALHYWTGRAGYDIGLVSGTRTFGHTVLFLLFVMFVATAKKSTSAWALALGLATHLFLDHILEFLKPGGEPDLRALTWPYPHAQFPGMPYNSLSEQLGRVTSLRFITFEIYGLALLMFFFYLRKNKRQK